MSDGGAIDAHVDAPAHDGGNLDAAMPDAIPPDAGPACASTPVAAYLGEQREQYSGSGGYERTSVEIRWELVASEGCVDRYTPSGRVSHVMAHPCAPRLDPPDGPIEASDGQLIVDRSSAPARYTVRGESSYETTITDPCAPRPPVRATVGGRWAEASGAFDGHLIAGGAVDIQLQRRWHLGAIDAGFTPPGDGCSEPPSERWSSTHHHLGDEATVTWIRVETDGCVDRFVPSGTATTARDAGPGCRYGASAHAIAPGDGTLQVDRSTDPATLEYRGQTSWSTTLVCPGRPPTEVFLLSGWAAWTGGMAFDGARWSGNFARVAWSFARGP